MSKRLAGIAGKLIRQPGVSETLLAIPSSFSGTVQAVGIAWGDKYWLQTQFWNLHAEVNRSFPSAESSSMSTSILAREKKISSPKGVVSFSLSEGSGVCLSHSLQDVLSVCLTPLYLRTCCLFLYFLHWSIASSQQLSLLFLLQVSLKPNSLSIRVVGPWF